MYNGTMKSSINSHQCCPPETAKVITVQNVAGIQQLANSFVRVLGNNSVYYVSRAHEVTLISSQVVEVRGYDNSTNPANYRNQIAYDVQSSELTYFTNAGIAVPLSSAVQLSDLEALDDKFSAQIRDVTAEVTDLGTQLDETNIQVSTLQENLNATNTNVENLHNALDLETTAREEADQGLTANINTINTDIAEVNSAVADLEQTTVQTDTAISTDASTVTLTKTRGALKGEQSEEGIALPVASETEAGVMNSATYTAVQQNSENIDSILGGAVVVSDLPATPTQAELTTAWEQATGKTELINRASIFDEANQKIWYYYENVNSWKSVSSEGAEVSVSIATNDTAGIVKGSTQDGQIAVEADGTMSLNGYDGITHDLDNLTQLVAGIEVPKLPTSMVYDFVSPAGANNPSTANNANITARVVNTNTGTTTNATLMMPMASSTQAGSITATDKAKLDSLDFSEMTITRVNNLPPAVVTGFEDTTYGATDLVLHLDTKDLATGGVSVQELTLASATPTSAGVMTGSQVVKLNEYDATIAELDALTSDMLNSAVSITGLGTNPTQADLTTAWKSASSETELINRAMIWDATNSKTWVYFGNVGEWVNTSSGSGSNVKLYNGYSTATDGANTAKFIYETFNAHRLHLMADSSVLSTGGIAIGYYAKVGTNGGGGIAISGNSTSSTNAEVTEAHGVAIGTSAKAYNPNSVAIGSTTRTTRDKEFSVGNSTLTRFVANVTDGELPQDAVTVNQLAKSKNRSWQPSTVYGVGELVTNEGKLYSVTEAFTSGEEFDTTNLEEIGGGGGTEVTLYDTYSTATDGANTAAFINSRLNNGQVYIGKNAKSSYSGSYNIAIGLDADGSSENKNNIEGSIAIGHSAKVGAGTSPIAIGSRASATGAGSIAIGGYPSGTTNLSAKASGTSAVALGQGATASQFESVALGYRSITARAEEVSIGSGLTTASPTTRYLANVTAGERDTDAVNLKQMTDAIQEAMLEKMYPIGSIYMSATLATANAVAEVLGGTWEAWGAGRVPVSVDSSDTSFNTVEKTGGEKTHTLTVAEIPSHTHNYYQLTQIGSWNVTAGSGGYYAGDFYPTGATGGGGTHNNLQPYITCYMYKRTA